MTQKELLSMRRRNLEINAMKPIWYADKLIGNTVIHCRFDIGQSAFRIDRAISTEMLADNEFVSMIMRSIDGERNRMMAGDNS